MIDYIDSNLDACLAELQQEATELENSQVHALEVATFRTFRHMVLEEAPLRTGNYRANFQVRLNSLQLPPRISGHTAGVPKELRGYRSSNRELLKRIRPAYAKLISEHLNDIATLFKDKRLSDIQSIVIGNNAFHASFVENGSARQKAWHVFALGEATARDEFNSLKDKLAA